MNKMVSIKYLESELLRAETSFKRDDLEMMVIYMAFFENNIKNMPSSDLKDGLISRFEALSKERIQTEKSIV